MIAASSMTKGLRTLWTRLVLRRSPPFDVVLRQVLSEQQRQSLMPVSDSSRGAGSVDVRL